MKKELLSIGILGLFLTGFASNYRAQDYIDEKIVDDKGNISLVTFKKNSTLLASSPNSIFADVLKLSPNSELRLKETLRDGKFKDEKYQMFYNNLKVEFGSYNVHYKDEKITSMNGDIFSTQNAVTVPKISANEAFSKALKHVGASKYMWEDAQYTAENDYKKPAGELVLLPVEIGKGQYHLHLV